MLTNFEQYALINSVHFFHQCWDVSFFEDVLVCCAGKFIRQRRRDHLCCQGHCLWELGLMLVTGLVTTGLHGWTCNTQLQVYWTRDCLECPWLVLISVGSILRHLKSFAGDGHKLVHFNHLPETTQTSTADHKSFISGNQSLIQQHKSSIGGIAFCPSFTPCFMRHTIQVHQLQGLFFSNTQKMKKHGPLMSSFSLEMLFWFLRFCHLAKML